MASQLKLIFFILLILGSAGCSVTEVLRLEDRKTIGIDTMVREVSGSPIVFVGESHLSGAHHTLQLEVIRKLHEQGKAVAIGLEMMEAPSQATLDAWVAGKVRESIFIRVYQSNWRNISWGLYKEIFLYARDHHVPLVALNAPREIVEQVSMGGFESLKEAQLNFLPPGIAEAVTPEYLTFIGESYTSHGRAGERFRHICEAQMLRNRFMARTIGGYLARHPGSTMVVLAGAAHTRHRGGIPMELSSPSYRIILPPIPGVPEESMDPADADYLMLEPFLAGIL